MIRLRCAPGPEATTEVWIGARLGAELRRGVEQLGAGRPVVALVDPAVPATDHGLIAPDWRRIELAGGEATKSFTTLESVLRQLAAWHLDRRTVLVVIGGGTLGDLGGLAASLFLRGVDSVQVPTTLLAMLDSSVGGKTALNLPEGKNLVGTFWPPRLMVADVALCSTLPLDHLRSGLAEAIKMGLGFDPRLFALLEREPARILAGDPLLLEEVVTMAVRDKIAVVEADPLETRGQRRCLNLGHTLGHALEAHSGYTLLHGHAVAQGLHFALEVGVARGAMAMDEAARAHRLLEAYGFARAPLPGPEPLLEYFSRDKKMQDGALQFVVPTGIGSCESAAIRPAELTKQLVAG